MEVVAAKAFKSKISSNIEHLNELNRLFKWIPNEDQIRPPSNVVLMKNEKLSLIRFQWRSVKDYIKHTVWGMERIWTDDGLHAVEEEPSKPYIFQRCEFPYSLEEGLHFVLWFNEVESSQSDEGITALLDQLVAAELGHDDTNDSYSFAWYVNPKMTVPDFFHVQVFLSVKTTTTAVATAAHTLTEAETGTVSVGKEES